MDVPQRNPFTELYPPLLNVYESEIEFLSNEKIEHEIGYSEKIANLLFFKEIINKTIHYSHSEIDIMAKYLKNTKLMKKIESDSQNEKNVNLKLLCKKCASKLKFERLHKGEILFRIGDTGDRFYFTLHGKMSVLKLKEIKNVKMNYKKYLDYLDFLKRSNEDYISNEVLKKNFHLLHLSSSEDIPKLVTVFFKVRLKSQLSSGLFSTVDDLREFFINNNRKFEEFDLDENELERLYIRKEKNIVNSDSELTSYISRHCKPSVLELVFFEKFQYLLSDDNEKQFTCFVYEPFLYFGPGDYFGDFALDSFEHKRNGTIRAETEAILSSIEDKVYLSIISPGRRIGKIKDFNFIYGSFFFNEINTHIFEKYYFHMFSPHEFNRGDILFKKGEKPKNLILLNEGKVKLSMTCTVLDLHKMIKFIYAKLFTASFYKNRNVMPKKKKMLSKQKLEELKEYISAPELNQLKTKKNIFAEEMTKMRTFELCILSDKEALGLEEIFMEIPYIKTAKVISPKAFCFNFEVDRLLTLLDDEDGILYPFVKISTNKLVSLLERLNHLKKNMIGMGLMKLEKEENDDIQYNNPDIQLCTRAVPQVTVVFPNIQKFKENQIPPEKNIKSIFAKGINNIYKKDNINLDSNSNSNSNKIILSQNNIKDIQNYQNTNKRNDNTLSISRSIPLIHIKNKVLSLNDIHNELINFNKKRMPLFVEINKSQSSGYMRLLNDNNNNNKIKNEKLDSSCLNEAQSERIKQNASPQKTLNASFTLSYVPLLATSISEEENEIKKVNKLNLSKMKAFPKISQHIKDIKDINIQKEIKKIFLENECKDIFSDKIKLKRTESQLFPNAVKEYYKKLKLKGYSILKGTNSHNTIFNIRFKKKHIKKISEPSTKTYNKNDNTPLSPNAPPKKSPKEESVLTPQY